MSALASLLSRDQIVSVRKIEEAIQRQVVSGGDLDTVLLEMGAVPENTMAAYRAAVYGLLPATREETMGVAGDVIGLVPRDVAERHRLVPVAIEGRSLVVAVTEPMGEEDAQQLAFLLGCELVPRIATEARVQMALARHYGVELSARMRRLQKKLDQRDPGVVPYVKPPEDNRLDPSRLQLPSTEEKEAERMLSEPPPAPEGPVTKRFGFAVPPAGNERPAPPSAPSAAAKPQARDAVGVSRVVGVGVREPEPAVSRRSGRAAGPPSETPLELTEPLTAHRAIEIIDGADSRDAILSAFQGFARTLLDYVALFVVHDDIAEGRDAAGSGPSAEQVQALAVPLDVPGSFAEVRRSAGPKVTQLDASEADRAVALGLGRHKAQPSILVPVAIRQRTVLILYGDRAGRPLGFSDVADLLALTSNVGGAFERLIMGRKFRGYEATAARTGEGRLRPGQLPPSSRPSRPTRASWRPPAADAPESESVVATAPTPPTSTPVSQEAARPAAPSRSAAATRARKVRTKRRTVMGLPAVDPSDDSWGSAEPAAAPPTSGPSAQASPPSNPPRHSNRPQAFTLLGIPRSAPPPPMSGPAAGPLAAAEEPAAETSRRDTLSDLPPAITVETSPRASPLPPSGPPAADDEPELTVEYGSAEDVELAALEDYDGSDSAGAAPFSSPREERRSSPNHRIDPRRDDPDAAPASDVVHLGRAAAAAAASITRRSSNPPPRQSPPPAEPDPAEPSVIVDMGETVEYLVRELSLSGPDDDEAVTRRILSQGEAALPVLVQHYPGPLWFDRHRPYRRLPSGRDVSPIARAIVAYGDRAVPYVATLLGSRDGDTRFYSALLADELIHPDLVQPLGLLVFDPDPGVRALALEILPRFARFGQPYDQMLEGIRIFARVPRKSMETRARAVESLGRLHDARSLDLLVKLLDEDEPLTAEAARRSLVALTRQDFGESSKRWRTWADRNRKRHRVEWLIDALAHPDEALRAAAGDELQALTQQYFGFHAAMSKHEREVAQRRYFEWWQDEGRVKFGHTP